jgi:hypothetical protein
MKRVGIITLHFYENFGSVLQAYALKTAINKIDGYQADIINYIPNLETYRYFTESDLIRQFEGKKKKFDDFRRNEIGISDTVISKEKLPDTKYDYYITGSDQVWNQDITKGDAAYFLDFVNKKTRVAYAASIAVDTGDEKIDKILFEKHISFLDFVSVRENSHREFIQQFTQKPVHSVADPTMLLKADDYEKIIKPPNDSEISNVKKDSFMLFYFLTHDPAAVDYANMMAKMLGLRLIHYFADFPKRVFPSNAVDMTFSGPGEFLWYIKNADLIFTNSFHGTVFSVLFERPFYTYTAKRKMLSRVLDLTTELELENRRFLGYKTMRDLSLTMDYSITQKHINEKRRQAEGFLTCSLMHPVK